MGIKPGYWPRMSMFDQNIGRRVLQRQTRYDDTNLRRVRRCKKGWARVEWYQSEHLLSPWSLISAVSCHTRVDDLDLVWVTGFTVHNSKLTGWISHYIDCLVIAGISIYLPIYLNVCNIYIYTCTCYSKFVSHLWSEPYKKNTVLHQKDPCSGTVELV